MLAVAAQGAFAASLCQLPTDVGDAYASRPLEGDVLSDARWAPGAWGPVSVIKLLVKLLIRLLYIAPFKAFYKASHPVSPRLDGKKSEKKQVEPLRIAALACQAPLRAAARWLVACACRQTFGLVFLFTWPLRFLVLQCAGPWPVRA